MSAPRCGTREAIVSHLEFNEPLDGPCACLNAAMMVEAERRAPIPRQEQQQARERLLILNAEAAEWESEHAGWTRSGTRETTRKQRRLRSA